MANTLELMLPSAHLSPQPKQWIDRFSRFWTYDRRAFLHFTTGRTFPLKIVLSHGDADPHL